MGEACLVEEGRPMFRDRIEAGRRLAECLLHLEGQDVVVLGLPRGGVPVAHEVARFLGAPLDVIVVRKLGVPFQPELAMGAIGEEGVRIIDSDLVAVAGVSDEELAEVETKERAELERRARLYRGGHPRESLEGRVAVIVDDGIATGSTARAAAQVARRMGADRVVVATPVAPREVEARLRRDADEVVVVETPYPFYAIGQFYLDFSQTADAEVIAALDRGESKAGADTSRPRKEPETSQPGTPERHTRHGPRR
jgi:putative phosphoribosyl transferase